jgi:hypothetical protein
MQEAFRVWLRPMGYEWRVCVDGLESAQWLLVRLSEAFRFQSREGIRKESGSPLCTFQVPYDPPYSYSRLKDLLATIPEVQLMSDLGSTVVRAMT